MATERMIRTYRTMRREHKDWPAHVAYWYARNLCEWRARSYWSSADDAYVVEHDGIEYRVRIEPDEDAWQLYDEDRENGILANDEEPTYAYWFIVIDTEWEDVDCLGGYAGGRIDARGMADTDDELFAGIWGEVVWPAIENHTQQDRDQWTRHLETVGSE